MIGFKLTVRLSGANVVVGKLRAMDTVAKRLLAGAVKRATLRTAGRARSTVRRKSGELASTIRSEFSRDGLAGWVKAGYGKLPRGSRAKSYAAKRRLAAKRRAKGVIVGRGAYGPIIEYGNPKRGARPFKFLKPAYEAERNGFRREAESALAGTVREVQS